MVTDKVINKTKNALLRYYATNRSSHGVHLLGLFAGLFTLIQTVQNSQKGRLLEIFTDVNVIFFEIAQTSGIDGIASSITDVIKFSLLFIATCILLFFVTRTIFRFSLFSRFSEFVMSVKPTEIEKRKEPVHQAIHIIVVNKAFKKKFWMLFPLNWFISRAKNSEHWKGNLTCLILAIVATSILIGLLW